MNLLTNEKVVAFYDTGGAVVMQIYISVFCVCVSCFANIALGIDVPKIDDSEIRLGFSWYL